MGDGTVEPDAQEHEGTGTLDHGPPDEQTPLHRKRQLRASGSEADDP
jgi:hypothetical protein